MGTGLAVYHCFARSGGTLVNRLLGASRDVVVLSEVGPAASIRDPIDQAVEWLGLVTPAEADGLRGLPFGDLLTVLSARAAANGQHLVVRDFVTPNFLPGAYDDVLASHALELVGAIGDDAARVVVVRRAAAVYASIVRTFPHLAGLGVDEFAVAYHGYARAVAGTPVLRYEDLTADPAGGLSWLCGQLGIAFDEQALASFSRFQACTGDLHVTTRSRGAGLDRVTALPERTDDEAYRAAAGHPLCRAADRRFGYPTIDDEPDGGSDEGRAVEALDAAVAAASRRAVQLDGHRRQLEGAHRRAVAEADDLRAEVVGLQRARDEAAGELARSEAVSADRERQIRLLLEELERR